MESFRTSSPSTAASRRLRSSPGARDQDLQESLPGRVMNVLVTGGAGFIGSHVVDALVARGDQVTVLDDFNDFYGREIKRKNLAGALSTGRVTLIEGDLCSEGDLGRVPFGAIESVVHLAARA